MPSPSLCASGYSPPALPDFFVQTPVSLVRCRSLTPVAKVTYDVLLSYRDSTGYAYPGQARLAAEVGVSEPTLRRALRLLVSASLVEPTRRGQGLTNCYLVHRSPLRPAEGKKRSVQNLHPVHSKPNKTSGELDRKERDPEQRDQPPPIPHVLVEEGGGEIVSELAQQIDADVALITQATGMDAGEAVLVAQAAASQGQPPSYIAELVTHVTSSPSVQNPAGCLRALVQRGQRRPMRGAGGVPPRAQRAALHPEHYGPGGKYAHLFHRPPGATSGRRTDLLPAHPQLPTADQPRVTGPVQRVRGPSAFEVAANPDLAGRAAEAWPRGQPLSEL
jgi:hypothetical protein